MLARSEECRKRTSIALAVLALACFEAAWGAAVDAACAVRVAGNFIRKDAVGSVLLEGRTVSDVRAHGSLWIAGLEPEGYVIVAADDSARPVIAFSADGTADEGGEENAFAEMLKTESEGVARSSAGEIVRRASLMSAALDAPNESLRERRARRWRELLGTGGMSLMGLADPQPQTILKAPMLSTKWNQCQPYNDFAPVYSQADGAYRGRMASGCVATAYAQVLNYWRWPARFAGWAENVHSVSGTSVGEMHYRVDGNAEFDYAGMLDQYPNHSTGYDLRGKVDERVRYGVGRLVQCAGTLARMQYASNGSGAQLDAPCKNNTFYAFGRNIGHATLAAENFAPLRESIMSGIPAMIGVPGHAIVADGWAEDASGNAYVHFNYGWGGGGDGYYTLDETNTQNASAGYIMNAITGHQPKEMAVVDKPKGVSALPLTLSWKMPDCHEGSVANFAVKYVSFNENVTEFTDDFSSSTGTSTQPDQIYATPSISRCGATSEMLWFGTLAEGEYVYGEQFLLTGRARVTYRVASRYALGMRVALEMRKNEGEWTTIDEPPLVTGGNEPWKSRSVFLGRDAGETVSFRWVARRTGNAYYPSAATELGVFVDDFSLDGVMGQEVGMKVVDGNVRSATFGENELLAGRLYVFSVAADGGEYSDAEKTRIEGRYRELLPQEEDASTVEVAWSEWRDGVEMPQPEITAVTALTGAAKPVAEGFYRECSRGTNVLLVACSEGVLELEARSGNLTLVPDERVSVHRVGRGRFAVVLDASAVTSQLNRSRVIFTLKARDANGSEAVKDVVLRFSDEGEKECFTPPAEATSGDSGTQGVKVPYAWLVDNGLASDGDTADEMEAAARIDSDGDGFANWQEYLCGTDPNDAKDKFEVYIKVEGGKAIIEWSVTNTPLAKYVVEGKRNLDDPQWREFPGGDADFGDSRFFRVVVDENQMQGQ